VVNTCTVTGKAEQKCRRAFRQALAAHPNAVLLITGCYAELGAGELASFDPRAVVLPGSRKGFLRDLPPILRDRLGAEADPLGTAAFLRSLLARQGASGENPPGAFALSTDSFLAHSRSSLKIQDGCDNACAFCRVRLARGPSRSLDAMEAVERVRGLEQAGQREVTLTGVNLSHYRSALGGRAVDLAGLANLILEGTESIALRFSSLYPESVTPEFCALAANPRIRPHFHLSVQSGSDKVLKAMNRPYRRSGVVRAVDALRAAKDDPFIAFDIIAGFPGETDGDFGETLGLCEDCAVAWVHAFPFSPRPGTAAVSLPGRVPEGVRTARAAELFRLAVRRKIAYIRGWEGRRVSGIIERPRESAPGGPLRAVTANFIHVILDGPPGRAFPGGGEVSLRILGPLEESILRNGESEALAEICESLSPGTC
jgi:threonylcarbamoyladenosine tRNA methylthiotransferase MtaB